MKFPAWLAAARMPALTIVAVGFATAVGLYAFTDIPSRLGWVSTTDGPANAGGDHDHAGHDHGDDERDHDHEGHSAADSIELSDQARANLRLATKVAEVQPFYETIDVPAVVAAWPGRTHVAVTSPLTGVINAINVSRGELVRSGDPMFTLRLTHQDLVETQQQFLETLGKLDVEEREIGRLTSATSSGAIAGKKRIEREYERDKLRAELQAARQAMLLHGLDESQIQRIETTRELVREVRVIVPEMHADGSLHHRSEVSRLSPTQSGVRVRYASMLQPPPASYQSNGDHEHLEAEFLVTELPATLGSSVGAGESLAQLSDYSTLLIEGFAYQRDGEAIRRVADRQTPVQAMIESRDSERRVIEGLQVVFLDSEVDEQSRALSFYVRLPNEIERSERSAGHRYVSWRYKPGQRMTLRVPIRTLAKAIVVPADAVVEEGPERYVFVENSDHFDRVPVNVIGSDSINVAINNDGQVWPGQSIAVSGAHQLQMAMKNRSGGAIDPHAGHNH